MPTRFPEALRLQECADRSIGRRRLNGLSNPLARLQLRLGLTGLAFGLATAVFFVALLETAVSVGLVTVENTDVTLYRHYGEAMANGGVPYRDIDIEYPPGALPLFVLPAIVTSSPHWYRIVFKVLMVLAIAALAVGVRKVGAEGKRDVIAPVGVVLLIAVLGSVAVTRFDVVPSALTVGALVCFSRSRWRVGALVLGIAIATKLYPVVLLPLVVLYAARRAGGRTAVAVGAIPLAVVALAYAPFVALSPGGVRASLDDQFMRPLEIESLGGSLLAGAHRFFGYGIPKQSVYYEFAFHTADRIADVSALILVATLIVLWARFARSERDAGSFLTFSAAAVAAALAFGKVFSPQYLLWLVPLVPLVPRIRGVLATIQLVAACFITALVFPRHWETLKYQLGGPEVTAILLRDLLVVGIVATLAWPQRVRR